ncbi:DinB family protein [Rhodohalobacter barkolensis]|uniref:DinB superfamily protein n=1 Tax=Rhodohalobacter barkolensis TaxID=2053187 RepID=A0A2N0VHC2_9BACT|nr:DinB family protein [Rhodohalobacter barkolensis]PKD43589.1 DinB superfamily protein [Rhodohalobacter barkolensis]
MMVEDFRKILIRDLDRLTSEINTFDQEENLWRTDGNVTNSAGNLCLHLCGNLKYYIGAKIGNTGYERDRPAEFSLSNVPRLELIEQVKETREVVSSVLSKMDAEQLNEDFPEALFGYPMTYGFFLIHLSGHLMYHLGQINYLRRILD